MNAHPLHRAHFCQPEIQFKDHANQIFVTHINDYGMPNGGAEIFLRDIVPYLSKVRIRESICLAPSNKFDEKYASKAPFRIRRGNSSDVNEAVNRGDAILCWGYSNLNRILIKKPKICVFNCCAEAFDQLHSCSNFVTHVIAANSNIESKVSNSYSCTKILPGVEPKRFSATCGREEARKSLGIKPEDFVVGMIGRIDEQKRQSWLVEAMKQLDNKFVAVFVGEGPMRKSLEQSAPSNCKFVGHSTSVGDWYSAFDVSCLLSSTEGCSAVMYESMYWGVPLIATPVGAATDVITDEYNGVFVKSIEDITKSINKIKEKLHLREKLSAEGRKTFEEVGHISHTAKKWDELFYQLNRKKLWKSFL